MATSTSHLETASAEPTVRTITRVVPNLRNPTVAEEYKRQREIINKPKNGYRTVILPAIFFSAKVVAVIDDFTISVRCGAVQTQVKTTTLRD